MKFASLAALAFVLLAEPQAKVERDPLVALAPCQPIAGLAGFQSTSAITYDFDPSKPHTLEATYVFPDRARWYVSTEAGGAQRQVIYRCADQYFALEAGRSESVPIERDANPEDWRSNCRALELRRALFLWPDGFAWRGEAQERTATAQCGTLVATLGEDGRPTEMRASDGDSDSKDVDSKNEERYSSVTWREQHGRWWPAAMEMFVGEERVWNESVERVDTQVHLLDLFFVPPDRRAGRQALLQLQVHHGDIAACYSVRVPLEPGTSWREIEQRWRKAIEPYVARGEKGWKLEAGAWVELAHDGTPAALIVRLQPGSSDPPAGAERQLERTAVLVGLNGLDWNLGTALDSLRKSLPAHTVEGRAYARFASNPGTARPVQVYLALESKP